MEQNEKKNEIFSKKFLSVILVISIFTNIIVLIKQSNPDIIDDIQSMFQTIPAPPEVSSKDHIRGNPNAKITIIEYSDFQCYYCIQFDAVMRSIIKEADVRWIYRHFPLGNHEYAGKAAEASECAGEQGKFWEYADALFALKGNFSKEVFIQTAQRTGLNASTFGKCLNSGKHVATIAAHLKEGEDIKIKATPTFYINGKRFVGFVPLDELKKLVELGSTKIKLK
jgi:protein-disulfide isomerase